MRRIGRSADVTFFQPNPAFCLTILAENHILNRSHLLIAISLRGGNAAVPRSVLEAIKKGIWDFEPAEVEYSKFEAANAMPGTDEKLVVLAERARRGLPLWHVQDRDDMESPPPPKLRRKPR
jgi:hypothetical protein